MQTYISRSEAETEAIGEKFAEGELEEAVKRLFPMPDAPAGEILTNARSSCTGELAQL